MFNRDFSAPCLKNIGVTPPPLSKSNDASVPRKVVRKIYPLTLQPVHTGTIALAGKSKSIHRKVRRSK